MSQKTLKRAALCALVLGCGNAVAADVLFVLGGDDPGETAFVADVTRQLGELRTVPGDRIASVSAGAFRSGYALAKGDRQIALAEVRTRGRIAAPRPAPIAPPPPNDEPPSAFGLLSDDHALLVPVGETALKAVLDAEASESLLTALISRQSFETLTLALPADGGGRQLGAIVTDVPLERPLALAAAALPQARRVGLLYSPAARGAIDELQPAASRLRLQLDARPLARDDLLITALRPLLDRCDLLLVLPDTGAAAATGQAMLQAAARAGRPVVAASESALRAGALVAVFTTREQLARQAAEGIRRYEQGARLAMIDTPRYFSVRHNAAVADSLGVSLPPDAALESSLAADGGARR